MKPKQIPGSRVVRIGNRIIAISDSELRDLEAKATGKRKPKLKRAADIAWAKKAKK